MLALGKYPAVTLAEARKKRDEARDLLNAGKHPTREKKLRKLRKAHEGENTFEKIARRWLSTKSERLNEKYATQCLVRMELHVFPTIGALPLKEITIPDVVEVVEAIGKRGTIETAKRMKQLIAQVFRLPRNEAFAFITPPLICETYCPARKKSTMRASTLANYPNCYGHSNAVIMTSPNTL